MMHETIMPFVLYTGGQIVKTDISYSSPFKVLFAPSLFF